MSELCNKDKATVEYLSSADGRFSFLNTSDDDHRATLGNIGNNDNNEHPFGAFTWAVHKMGIFDWDMPVEWLRFVLMVTLTEDIKE
eukprot:5834319-Ditylum_brightwellii.AAC.1